MYKVTNRKNSHIVFRFGLKDSIVLEKGETKLTDDAFKKLASHPLFEKIQKTSGLTYNQTMKDVKPVITAAPPSAAKLADTEDGSAALKDEWLAIIERGVDSVIDADIPLEEKEEYYKEELSKHKESLYAAYINDITEFAKFVNIEPGKKNKKTLLKEIEDYQANFINEMLNEVKQGDEPNSAAMDS